VELALALRRHTLGECVVIPIFLRPVDSSGAPFTVLQGLPRDARPVTTWPDPDVAFADIAQGIRKAALAIRHGDSDPDQLAEGETGVDQQASSAARGRDVQRIGEYRKLFD